MPCSDGLQRYSDEIEYQNKQQLRKDYDAMKNRLDEVTQYACEMATIFHRTNMLSMLSPKTLIWVANHLAWDNERKLKETK